MKYAKRTLKYSLFATGFLITFVTFLVVAAGLVYLSYGIDAATVEKYLGEQIKRPVRIESIRTRWRGLHVEVEADGIRILRQDGSRLALRLAKLEITVDPLTLLGPEPGLERIVVYGLSLRVQRSKDGTIRVGDLVADPRRSPNPALEWFLDQPNSEIRGGSLVWKDELGDDRSISFRDIDIAIEKSGGSLRFDGQASPPGIMGEHLTLRGEIQGQPLRSGLWDGRIEVDVAGLQLDELPRVVRDVLPWQTPGGVTARIDTEWLDGHIIEAAGELSMNDFEIPFEGGRKKIPVRSFSSTLSWQQNLKDWRIEFGEPVIDVNGSVLATRRLVVARTKNTRAYHVGALELAQVVALREQLQFELPWHEVHAHIKPDGRLDGISVVTRGPFLSPDHWRVEAGFEGIGWHPFEGIPGVTGAQGRLSVEPSGGEVSLESRSVKLDLPGVLAESLYFNEFGGRVKWSRDSGYWNVEISDIDLSNSDLQSLRGRARLQVPTSGSGKPRIDSAFTVAELEVGKFTRYLPLAKLPPKLAKWLDAGLLDGTFHDARVDLAGDLTRFPFRDGGGSFYVSTQLVDAELHYADGWPEADGIFGYINLNNAAMHADIASAELAGSHVVNAVVDSSDIFRRGAEVGIKAKLAAPAGEVVDFLTRGPLSRSEDPLTMSAAGAGSLELDIHLPLARLKTGVEVAGRYEVGGAELTVVDRFRFQDLAGTIEFTESTVAGTGITGMLLGGPVTVDLDTLQAGRPPFWRISARGGLDTTELVALLGSRTVTSHVTGLAGWSGTLVVGEGGADLKIDSDLGGVDIALPAPVKKMAEETRPTSLRVRIEGGYQEYRFVSGPLAGTIVYEKSGGRTEIRRGVLAIGKADAGKPPAEGIRVDVAQPFLNLDKWLAVLEVGEAASEVEEGSFQSALREVELEFKDVRFLSRNLGVTNARATSVDGVEWRAWLSGDHLRGQLDATLRRGEPGNLRMDFERLYLPKPRGKRRTVDPDARRRYPNVEIHADHFVFGEWDLGSLDLKASSYVGRWSVDELLMVQPGLTIAADGHWAYGESGSTTRLRAEIQSEDIAIALARLNLPPHIAESKARLEFNLEWPGQPQGFLLRNLDGSYVAVAEAGRFLNVDPGSGRLIGLFNVDAISRRLSLDFSDIFSKGLAFDHIEAKGKIEDGNLHSDEMFIVAPAALIEITGRTGLVKEDYDLKVVVAPDLGSQISMISAIANPVAGAMVFIAQKVFKKQLSKMIQYQYDITGSWDEPEFTTVRWEPELLEETSR